MTVAKDKSLVTLETTWDLKTQAKSDVRKLGGQQYLPGLVMHSDREYPAYPLTQIDCICLKVTMSEYMLPEGNAALRTADNNIFHIGFFIIITGHLN